MLKVIKRLSERKAVFFGIAIGLTLLVIYLSLGEGVSIKSSFTYTDKIMHFAAYFSLLVSWFFACFGLQKGNPYEVLFIALGLVFLGILMEYLQYKLTTYRTLDFYDILANTLGIVFGVIVYTIFIRLVKIVDR